MQFINGIRSRQQPVITATSEITYAVISGLSSYSVYQSTYDAGKQAANGFIKGLDDSVPNVKKHSAYFAGSAVRGIDDELLINSPSKIFYQKGEYSAIGFINALDDYSKEAAYAGAELGNSAESGLKDGINKAIDMLMDEDFDNSLHIRPVLDLDEFQNGRNRFNKMMSGFNGYSVGVAMDTANSISGMYSGKIIEVTDQNGKPVPVDNVSVTQNNYYVNPHSNYEIYKSEKNLVKEIERVSSKRR